MFPNKSAYAVCFLAWGLPSLPAFAVEECCTNDDTGEDECAQFGEAIADNCCAPRVVYFGETADFRVGGRGWAGSDIDACEWSLSSDAVGEMLQAAGSPVTYQAPDDYGDYTAIDFSISVTCVDPGDTDGSAVTQDFTTRSLDCTASQKQELQQASGTSFSGGGCNSPQSSAWMLLPLMGLGVRRWTRRSAD